MSGTDTGHKRHSDAIKSLTQQDLLNTHEFTGAIGSLTAKLRTAEDPSLSDCFTIHADCDSSQILSLINEVNEGDYEDEEVLMSELERRRRVRDIIGSANHENGIAVEERPEISEQKGFFQFAKIVFKCSDGQSVYAEYGVGRLIGAPGSKHTKIICYSFRNYRIIQGN